MTAADWASVDAEKQAAEALERIGERLYRRFKGEKQLQNLICGRFRSPEVGAWLKDDQLPTEFRLSDDNFSPGELKGDVDFSKKKAKICRMSISFWRSAPPPKPLSYLIEMDSVDMMNIERFMATAEEELRCKVVKLSTSYKVVSFWLEFPPDRFKTQEA